MDSHGFVEDGYGDVVLQGADPAGFFFSVFACGSDGFVEGGSGGVSQSCKISLKNRPANRVSQIPGRLPGNLEA